MRTTFSWYKFFAIALVSLMIAQFYMMFLAKLLGEVWFPSFHFLEVTEPIMTAAFLTALIATYYFDHNTSRRRIAMLGFACGFVALLAANANYRMVLFAPGVHIGYVYVFVSGMSGVFLIATFRAYRRMTPHARNKIQETI